MDYIPKKDSEFIAWVKNLLDYVQLYLKEFNILEAVFQPLLVLYAAFEAAYAKYLDPNSGAVDVAEKTRSRKILEKDVRAFVKAFLMYSPFVSDKDRDEMRLPIHDTKPTPTPAPSTYPEYDIDTSIQTRLTVHFWDSASKKKAKPKGVHGAEIRWEMREDAPVKAEDLINSDFTTRTPHSFTFTGDKQGQRVYFCLRWESDTGEKGTWGAIVSAVVP
jgi:hypothetical protein